MKWYQMHCPFCVCLIHQITDSKDTCLSYLLTVVLRDYFKLFFHSNMFEANFVNVYQLLSQLNSFHFPSGFQDDLLCKKEKLDYSTSQVVSKATLASLYGNNLTRRSNHPSKSSIDPKSKCSPSQIILSDKAHPYNHHKEFSKVEDEERPHGTALGTKRMHVETRSLSYDPENLPSNMEEEAPGNGFMTAKTKLVTGFSFKIPFYCSLDVGHCWAYCIDEVMIWAVFYFVTYKLDDDFPRSNCFLYDRSFETNKTGVFVLPWLPWSAAEKNSLLKLIYIIQCS